MTGQSSFYSYSVSSTNKGRIAGLGLAPHSVSALQSPSPSPAQPPPQHKDCRRSKPSSANLGPRKTILSLLLLHLKAFPQRDVHGKFLIHGTAVNLFVVASSAFTQLIRVDSILDHAVAVAIPELLGQDEQTLPASPRRPPSTLPNSGGPRSETDCPFTLLGELRRKAEGVYSI
jgi:hypothetical protein